MMKPLFRSLAAALVLSFSSNAQTVADFENLGLATDTFDNGSASPLGYTYSSGNLDFENHYDTAWGGFWTRGWAISTVKDSTTAGFSNLYGASTAQGQGGSNTYAVGTNFARAYLTGNAEGKLVNGLYLTNTTFAAISMRDGDNFAKKFGGASGNDSDWFKLQIIGSLAGNLTDTVDFYLADYRFGDNNQDYIVKDWQWVDLTSLGNVDTVHFILTSSDVGQNGMNTPAYYAIDGFTTKDSGLNLSKASHTSISFYPNPATNKIHLTGISEADVEIYNTTGIKVWAGKTQNGSIDLNGLKSSLYILKISTEGSTFTQNLMVK